MFSMDSSTKPNGHEESWKVLVQCGSEFQGVYEPLPGGIRLDVGKGWVVRHWTGSPGSDHSPMAARTPGACGQCCQAQGGSAGVSWAGPGVHSMILVSPSSGCFLILS